METRMSGQKSLKGFFKENPIIDHVPAYRGVIHGKLNLRHFELFSILSFSTKEIKMSENNFGRW